MAIAVPARLWLGGALSPRRDLVLIMTLGQMIRAYARSLALLVCGDGLAISVTAFRRVFRHPVWAGRRGWRRLVLEPEPYLGQVVKRHAQRQVLRVEQRLIRGTADAIAVVLAATHSGTAIQTASVERLNATLHSALAVLGRRGGPSPTPRRP